MQPPEAKNQTRSRLIDDTFFVSVALKGIGGLVELLSGVALVFLSVSWLQQALAPLSHVGIDLSQHLNGNVKGFAALYFGVRGAIRVAIAIALLQERLWAYPVALLLLATAVLYQGWLLATGHFSWGLTGLTLFDLWIIGLTTYEYRKLKAGGHLLSPHL